MRVSELWIYPIKSCRGIPVGELALDDRGPVNDRRWMLVDDHSHFLTQREYPRLALVDVAIDGEEVRISASGAGELRFQRDAGSGAEDCVVWRDTVALQHVSRDADQWFSDFLGSRIRLMRMPRETERVVNRDYSPERRLVTLADGYPMLLIGEGSLALLNEKLAERGERGVPMRRFRPNVVVAGTAPHDEDDWKSIRIGNLECDVVKPCARCAIPTVDVNTGVAGVEPLRTLATYRKQGSKVYFGQNVIHRSVGSIRMADEVEVI